ncbi:MAG: AmmeMemoRadiSam system protein A [Candidatus Kariarchaeaceae archaeon]
MRDLTDTILDIAETSVKEIVLKQNKWLPELENELYQELSSNQGAFTTLYILENEEKNLRGCIGYPDPIHPLAHSIAHSARQAAIADPRFSPVLPEELPCIIIEVEALSPISEISNTSTSELYSAIEIGLHGLIIEYMGFRGLLLPKVASRYQWTPEEFLQHVSMKAGLSANSYLKPDAKIFQFTSTLFARD